MVQKPTSLRNIGEVLSTQGKSAGAPLDRALDDLRNENISLQDENEDLIEKNESLEKDRAGLVQLVKDLNKELDDLKNASKKKEMKLYAELRNMKISWDSLYNEHRAAEERYEKERKLHKGLQSKPTIDDECKKPQSQTDMINSVIKKKSASSNSNVSPLERKLHELRDEKEKLKSEVVKLRTLYREEKYKNEHRDLVSSCTESFTDDSESSLDQEKPLSRPSLFASLSKRNLGARPAMPGKSDTNSSMSTSTRNLWARMKTSSRNLQTQFDSDPINLAMMSYE